MVVYKVKKVFQQNYMKWSAVLEKKNVKMLKPIKSINNERDLR